MDNKKNTILLTVIAVATLLVAVVGATFAYFTAIEGEGQSTKITVKTGTGSSSSFDVSQNLNVYADQSTFAEGKTSKIGTSTGKVYWTAPGSTNDYTPSEDERSFCYTVTLNITSNNFQYDEAGNTTGTAQLLFNISRSAGNVDGTDGTVEEIKAGVTNLTYTPSPVTGISTTTEKQTATFTGWDITTKGKASYQVGGTYKMTAKETKNGDAVTKMTDKWTATVTLVNLATSQNYNTNKEFTATLDFKQVKCS